MHDRPHRDSQDLRVACSHKAQCLFFFLLFFFSLSLYIYIYIYISLSLSLSLSPSVSLSLSISLSFFLSSFSASLSLSLYLSLFLFLPFSLFTMTRDLASSTARLLEMKDKKFESRSLTSGELCCCRSRIHWSLSGKGIDQNGGFCLCWCSPSLYLARPAAL